MQRHQQCPMVGTPTRHIQYRQVATRRTWHQCIIYGRPYVAVLASRLAKAVRNTAPIQHNPHKAVTSPVQGGPTDLLRHRATAGKAPHSIPPFPASPTTVIPIRHNNLTADPVAYMRVPVTQQYYRQIRDAMRHLQPLNHFRH